MNFPLVDSLPKLCDLIFSVTYLFLQVVEVICRLRLDLLVLVVLASYLLFKLLEHLILLHRCLISLSQLAIEVLNLSLAPLAVILNYLVLVLTLLPGSLSISEALLELVNLCICSKTATDGNISMIEVGCSINWIAVVVLVPSMVTANLVQKVEIFVHFVQN